MGLPGVLGQRDQKGTLRPLVVSDGRQKWRRPRQAMVWAKILKFPIDAMGFTGHLFFDAFKTRGYAGSYRPYDWPGALSQDQSARRRLEGSFASNKDHFFLKRSGQEQKDQNPGIFTSNALKVGQRTQNQNEKNGLKKLSKATKTNLT